MKTVKFLAMVAVAMSMVCPAVGRTVVDVYAFSALLHVPQVINNSDSKGVRVYRTQRLKGELRISYRDSETAEIELQGTRNMTFKVAGANVTYTTDILDTPIAPLLAYIGNNKTSVFKTATICFAMEALPSYVSCEPDSDNSFYLTFAGRGMTTARIREGSCLPKTFMGNVAGSQGCGCSWYGHVSPTRAAGVAGPTNIVIDVAAVYGTWRATYSRTTVSE